MGIRTIGIGVVLVGVVACGDVVSNPDAPAPVDARIPVDTSVPIDVNNGMCDPLTAPTSGMVATTNNGNFPSTATYTCGVGFNLVGSPTRTCASDGSWSGSAPTCASSSPRIFSDCAQTGNTGPLQTQCDTAYATTALAGAVTVTDGIQRWTVPTTGTYRIVAAGAAGSSLGGWFGARMQGDFALTQGTELKILVGQLPVGVLAGGGGTFVTQANNTPLIVAGGGGSGNCATHCVAAEAGGRIETTGGTMTGLTRATGGAGGLSGNTVSGAGGGLLTSGQTGGLAFVNGGIGAIGMTGYLGGFGGGGARNGANGTGGGGGYSGGAANSNGTDTTLRFGGGGGSFNAGTNQTNTPNVNTTTGSVTITPL